VPAGDPVKASAGSVGYARSGPYHKDGTARVTDDPIGDALEGASFLTSSADARGDDDRGGDRDDLYKADDLDD
jgi:hypothetical protein